MTRFQERVLGALTTAFLMGSLSSCSRPAAPVQTADAAFYWSAAQDRYVAGDYLKAISHLDHLLEAGNPFVSRALPMSLVLTSGTAAGYMELADYYTAGAKANKKRALDFQRKASDYRALANHMVLHFAENTKKLSLIDGDSMQLAFGPPKGNANEPVLFTQISHGMVLAQTDEEGALELALDRGVLFAACRVAGAPNNLAKASEILQRGEFLVRRAKFMKAVSDLLDQDSELYSRGKLDDTAKLAMLKQMSQDASKDADTSHTAMVMQVAGR
ncbi:MAG TPA: hypothetical protein VKU19_42410 [Bryobacteraceae bacterium]|nr:hypothetical protein [Bryobacteraceae bacterium]